MNSIVLVFELAKPDNAQHQLISLCDGSLVGTEIALVDNSDANMSLSFTAKPDKPLYHSMVRKFTWSADRHRAIRLDAEFNQYCTCAAFLHDLCESAPAYNATDPVVARMIPSYMHDIVLPDYAAGVKPKEIPSVFTTQAAVLMLRACREEDPESRTPICRLATALKTENSRTLTPSSLHSIAKNFGEPVDPGSFFVDLAQEQRSTAAQSASAAAWPCIGLG